MTDSTYSLLRRMREKVTDFERAAQHAALMKEVRAARLGRGAAQLARVAARPGHSQASQAEPGCVERIARTVRMRRGTALLLYRLAERLAPEVVGPTGPRAAGVAGRGR